MKVRTAKRRLQIKISSNVVEETVVEAPTITPYHINNFNSGGEMNRPYYNWAKSQIQIKERFDRVAKTHTLFRLEGDTVNVFRAVPLSPHDPKSRDVIERRYGGQAVEIWRPVAMH